MASKILTIEIGSSLTKICEMDSKAKKPTVYQCFHVVTPPGVLDDGVVENNPELVYAIQTALSTKKIKTKQVVFAVASNRVANRDVDIPVVKENKIQSMLASNAQDYFPVDLSQYEVCYSGMEEMSDESGAKKLKLAAHAIPKYLVQSYRDLADSCGLTMVGIDLVGNSIAEIFKGQLTEGVHLVVKIDSNACLLTVFHNDKVVFQRSAMAGVDPAINMLQNSAQFSGKLPYTEALKRLRTQPYFNTRLLSRDELSQMNQGTVRTDLQDRTALTQALEDMVEGIIKIADFYNSQNTKNQIQDIFLTGIGAELVGVRELLSNELGMNCIVVTSYGNLSLDRKIANTSVCAYAACIGAGFRPVLKVTGGKKSADGSATPSAVDWSKVAMLLFILGIVCSGALLFFSQTKYQEQLDAYNRAQSDYNNMMETQQKLAEYQRVETEYNNFIAVHDYTRNIHENFLQIIAELEEYMPTDFVVSTYHSDGTQLSMDVKVNDIISIATVLQKLRYFPEFQTVRVDTFTSEEKDDGSGSEGGFTVICEYVPYGTEKIGTEAYEDRILQEVIFNEADLLLKNQQENAENQSETQGNAAPTSSDGTVVEQVWENE